MCHLWQSPDAGHKQIFLELDLKCEPDPSPGVVIIADEHRSHATASAVKNLQKDLQALLQASPPRAIVYWKLEQDESSIARLLRDLTLHPIFLG